MKKTFTINISGIIFHIDEDAFNKLNAYMDSIKKHFQHMEGKDEIFNDIESRIAEILQEKLNEQKQVITIDDIKEVITTMGQPSQFSEEDEAPQEEAQTTYHTRAYKRLYRDIDNRWIGGVCSGIGAYFRIDPIWIRILFFISIWIGGAGLIIYLILWIVLPEARTTAEKLEMRGEKVNISNIEKSINEEVEHLKNKLNDLKNQAKGTYKKKSETGRTVFDEILKVFVSILIIAGKVLVVLIGIILTVAGIGLIIAFLSAIFGWGGSIIMTDHEVIPYSLPDFFHIFLGTGFNFTLFKLALILFIGIPVVMLFYNGVRLIFGLDRIKYIGITAFNLWIIGLIMVFYFSFKIARHYKYEDALVKDIPIEQPLTDTIFLEMDKSFLDEHRFDYDYFYWDEIGLLIFEEGEFYCTPKLEIRESNTDQLEMTFYSKARGKTRSLASQRVENIQYEFNQTDSSFVFNPYFEFSDNDSWHGEQLEIVLNVPKGKYVQFDKNIWRIMNDYTYYKFRGREHRSSRTGDKIIQISNTEITPEVVEPEIVTNSWNTRKRWKSHSGRLINILVLPWTYCN